MRRKLASLIVALLCLALGSAIGVARQPKSPSARWEPNIRKFEASDRQNPPPKGAVLFVGSSSICMWKSLADDFAGTPAINRGFGGSEIADSLYYADRIILPYAPRLVVLYAGDNDLAKGKPPARLLADYKELVARIHQNLPETRIAYIAIKPSIARARLLPQIKQANALIRDSSSHDKRLDFIDVFTPMLNADGSPRKELFVKDGLHMNGQGYALWTSLVKPFLK